ncbi:MAG: prolipoprotein diacylglyceryl transferase [Candidatus Magasanikbacteria bacterium]|jgi:phosphatidylglycerol---prolipoprotein diacylglyceryl transferase|nr:prolipoprotein diacylglyceryl transferase [Candidatus Magasanikbacteria bacterium]
MINTINPILLEIGPFAIRWYGLFLAVGVVIASLIIRHLFIKNDLKEDDALSLVMWLVFGGLIGARLGEVLFYEPAYYLAHPMNILFVHHGGLSSHGMTIGLLIAFLLFNRKKQLNWKKSMDIVSLGLPIVAGCIRLGNFFNSEIVGRVTNVPWAIQFPRHEIPALMRHPSQLYESILAFSIFLILWMVYKKKKFVTPLFITHLFMFLYFSSRFFIEFVKEYQTLTGGLTMGQWLSIPFIIWAVGWFVYERKYIIK